MKSEAIVIIEKKQCSLILTPFNNINWLDNTIIDNEDILENYYILDEFVDILNISNRKSERLKVKNININQHQLIIDKKLYIVLHILE